MRMKNAVAVMIGVSTIALGFAAEAAFDGNAIGTIETIQVGPTGKFNFWLVGRPILCSSALDRTEGVVDGSLGVDVNGQKAFLSTVTAAYLSGKKVHVWANNLNPPPGAAGPGCVPLIIELIP